MSPSIKPRSLSQARDVLQRLRWFNCVVIFLSPLLAIYGVLSAPSAPHRSTLVFAWTYYVFNMLGITAGYHRLWSHRSYTAHPFLQFLLASAGSGAVQGSIRWWARTHRIHHRYTDTDLDPYNAKWGLWWTHVGWMLVKSPSFEEKVERERAKREALERERIGLGDGKTRVRVARVDVSDLDRNWVVRMQHEWYFLAALVWGALIPVCAVGLASGRWREGLVWAGLVRLVFVHHCTFAVNSLAHHLGHSPYPHPPPHPPRSSISKFITASPPTSPQHPHTAFPRPHPTARNHLLTAILTLGEGYHAFHHAFPCDYRCAEHWWEFDPTKWVVAVLAWDFSGLAEVGRWVGGLMGMRGGEWGTKGGLVAGCAKWMGLSGPVFGFDVRQWALVRDRRVFEVKEWIEENSDVDSNENLAGLEEWTWEDYKLMSQTRPLVVIAGFIHDVRALLGDSHHQGSTNSDSAFPSTFPNSGSSSLYSSGSAGSNGSAGPSPDIGSEEDGLTLSSWNVKKASGASTAAGGMRDATTPSRISAGVGHRDADAEPVNASESKQLNPDHVLHPDPKRQVKQEFAVRSRRYAVPVHLPLYPHPGGIPLLRHAIGTDATAAFFGGVYEHGWGAHEMLAKMRVAILKNGVEQVGGSEGEAGVRGEE